MIEPPLQRRVPLPPQLTRRVGALGVLAFVLFGIITFRLWYLQVLTGTQNVAVANGNVQRPIPIAAPRGEIVDRNGTVLATTRAAAAVSIVADDLPPAHTKERWSLFVRLGRVLGVKPADISHVIATPLTATTPGYQPAVIASPVSNFALTYLSEHARDYPGVVVQQVNLRSYPQGDIGAIVLGQIGPITGGTNGELGSAPYKGIRAGDYVGQAGLEAVYNRYLQGKDGTEHLEVDASGYPTGAAPTITKPVAGSELKTSLDLGLEREGYSALRRAMKAAQKLNNPATAAAFIAMDPFDGQVYALGSLPTYDPNMFVTPPSTAAYDRVLRTTAFVDRAIDGLYPTGSTFKPITALGALRAGLITAQTTQGGVACVRLSPVLCLHNSGGANLGNLDLVQALTVSEDTYFYLVGEAAEVGHAIQNEARQLGLGSHPGIDLPGGGSAGVVPDRAVIDKASNQYIAQHCNGTRVKSAYAHSTLAVTACSQGYLNIWTIGQNVLLATGQGFLEATPLQMAVAYSAIVNGGTVWQPRIAQEILTPSGTPEQQLPPPASHHVVVPQADQSLILQGLNGAAQSPSGTSDAVFGNFPRPVYGKTGTAVHAGQKDQSWYVVYAPDAKRPIVIAITIEQGGFGAAAAAPAARLMLSQWFGLPKVFLPGSNPDH